MIDQHQAVSTLAQMGSGLLVADAESLQPSQSKK